MGIADRLAAATMLAVLAAPVAMAQPQHNVRPAEGLVPDQATATTIAEAILTPIYGKLAIDGQRPLRAEVSDGVWIVRGTLPRGVDGGVAEVWIDKVDGRVLRVTHGR